MKNRKYLFAVVAVCTIVPAYSESLLQVTPFPKTFNDVGFIDRWAVMAEAYSEFDRLYDEDGNCVVGCPYAGITIQQDKEDVDEASAMFANMVANSENPTNNTPPVVNQPGNNTPGTPSTPSQPSVPHQPYQPTPPPSNGGGNGGWAGGGSVNDLLPLGSPVKRDSLIITSDFYFRKNPYGFHNGVDIGVVRGTDIYATGGGTIEAIDRSGRDSKGELTYNGPYVKIKHGNTGFYSSYLHLSYIPPELKKGMAVNRGTYLGKSGGAKGDCKRCSGAHLHYSISTIKSGRDIYVDVLCPWRGTKVNKEVRQHKEVSVRAENNTNISEFGAISQPKHSAFNRYDYYSFDSKKTRQNAEPWRIEAKHCMVTPSDKLPDEK